MITPRWSVAITAVAEFPVTDSYLTDEILHALAVSDEFTDTSVDVRTSGLLVYVSTTDKGASPGVTLDACQWIQAALCRAGVTVRHLAMWSTA